MNKCKLNCSMCPYVSEKKEVKVVNFSWRIRHPVNCNTENLVYLIECSKDKCNEKYIGETERKIKARFSEHKRYVTSQNFEYGTGYHFNLPGHTEANMKVIIQEHLKNKDTFYRKETESFL